MIKYDWNHFFATHSIFGFYRHKVEIRKLASGFKPNKSICWVVDKSYSKWNWKWTWPISAAWKHGAKNSHKWHRCFKHDPITSFEKQF